MRWHGPVLGACLCLIVAAASVLNGICALCVFLLLVRRAFHRDFSRSTYMVSLSVSLFILIALGVLLHSYRVAHELGWGVGMAASPPAAGCVARGVGSWEHVLRLPETCAPDSFRAHRVPETVRLLPLPTHTLTTRAANTKSRVEVVKCSGAGVACFSQTGAAPGDARNTYAIPWSTGHRLRIGGAHALLLVVPDDMVHAGAHNVRVPLPRGREAWVWSRTTQAVPVDAEGAVLGVLPVPRPGDVFVALTRDTVEALHLDVDLSHRCPPGACHALADSGMLAPLRGGELHTLARTTVFSPFALAAVLYPGAHGSEAAWEVAGYSANTLLAILLLVYLDHLCLDKTEKSGGRILLCTQAGASFNWVALAAAMVLTQRVVPSRRTVLFCVALCAAQLATVAYVVAHCIALESRVWLEGASWPVFLAIPSIMFHGSVFLVNAGTNAVVSAALVVYGLGLYRRARW